MSLRNFVKKNAPDWLLPLLKSSYRTVKRSYALLQEKKVKSCPRKDSSFAAIWKKYRKRNKINKKTWKNTGKIILYML